MEKAKLDAIETLRKESGQIKIKSKLVSFLYQLMRDELVTGAVESLVQDCEIVDEDGNPPFVLYTNGWLADYAENLAIRLGDDPIREDE